MNETEALTRRDDELTDLDVPSEAAPVGITSADELPRDERGRVLGVWHVSGLALAEGEKADARTMDPALEGDLVDRAISLGYGVSPGPDLGPRITIDESGTE